MDLSDDKIHLYLPRIVEKKQMENTIGNLCHLGRCLTSQEMNLMIIVHAFRLASILHSYQLGSCLENIFFFLSQTQIRH